jgi:hypothetical protein
LTMSKTENNTIVFKANRQNRIPLGRTENQHATSIC